MDQHKKFFLKKTIFNYHLSTEEIIDYVKVINFNFHYVSYEDYVLTY